MTEYYVMCAMNPNFIPAIGPASCFNTMPVHEYG
jgi:hypothetical protein